MELSWSKKIKEEPIKKNISGPGCHWPVLKTEVKIELIDETNREDSSDVYTTSSQDLQSSSFGSVTDLTTELSGHDSKSNNSKNGNEMSTEATCQSIINECTSLCQTITPESRKIRLKPAKKKLATSKRQIEHPSLTDATITSIVHNTSYSSVNFTGDNVNKPYFCLKEAKGGFHTINNNICERNIKTYKCSINDTTLHCSSIVKRHMVKYKDEKLYKRDFSKSAFSCSGRLKVQTNTVEKPYKCEECGNFFTQLGSLKIHKRLHTGEKPYKCDLCKTAYTYKYKLMEHRRHSSCGNYNKSKMCKPVFIDSGNLRDHGRTCSREKKYKCDTIFEAALTCPSTLNLRKRKKEGDKLYKCDMCKAAFRPFEHLKRHMYSHIGEKPYKCDTCATAFVTFYRLQRHMSTHTGDKSYMCDLCGALFTQSPSLKYHKRTHTGEKPYGCDICEAAFRKLTRLKYHKRKHTGEKPYKCDLCEAVYSQVGSLNVHKRKHIG